MSLIVLLAPAPNMGFASLPSGSTYLSDANGLIEITNGNINDQIALVNAGCIVLNPVPGGGYNFQNGTAYTLASADNGNMLLFTSASAVTVTLPANLPVGFRTRVFVAGTGGLTVAAGSGANAVSPIGVLSTTVQYYAFDCSVIYQNGSNSAAGWDVIISPTPGLGSGIVGATTLSALYSQDSTNHYAQYTTGNVYEDGTSSNNGTWLKTGTGNGSGNWTQVSTATLTAVQTALSAEVTRAEASESGIISLMQAQTGFAWPDDGMSLTWGIFDASGYPILASTSLLRLTGSAADYLNGTPALTEGYLWADDSPPASTTMIVPPTFGPGVSPLSDPSGNIIIPYGAAPGPLDDYVPYVNKPDGSLRASNNDPYGAGIAYLVASTRGSPSTGGISGIHQMGPILKWVDDATASGNAPYIERRQFNMNAGQYLANLGGITKLIHVIDIGHSLTVGAIAGLLTTAPFFSRGVMFNGGPKVYQIGSGGWSAPAPICADGYNGQLQELLEYYEFQNSNGQGETHGGGVVYWASAGNIASNEAILFSSVGASGAIMTQLLSGGTQFSNLVRVAERSAAIAAINGWGWECYVCCSIGENDYLTYSTNASGFQTNLEAFQASVQTAIQGIYTANGWSAPTYVPLICEQPSSWTDSTYDLATCALVYVFPALARAYPNLFKLVGPEYYTDMYATGTPPQEVHKTAEGYKLDGQYMMRTVAKIRAAAATPGLYATGVSNSGTTMTITTNATSNLAIDTSFVSNPGQYGLRVLDVTNGNANVALSGIGVSGTSITATLATENAGHTYMLGIGDIGTAGNAPGPTTGPRTCIRDSSSDVSSSDTGSTAMYNFLSHDQIEWTCA
ncbi:MAG TPA: hypothetical protein VMF67_02445 [Rhizomicrobium sp.]|nr:hypothetical protein [Rhizomicrobium sp.]